MVLLNAAQKSLHNVIRSAYVTISDEESFDLLKFLKSYPSQVCYDHVIVCFSFFVSSLIVDFCVLRL